MPRFIHPTDDYMVNLDLVEYAELVKVGDQVEWIATMNSGRKYSLGRFRSRDEAAREKRRAGEGGEMRRA